MNAPTATPMRAFLALCERDFWVAFRRQLGGFLAQTLLQPVFYLFIFGRVLPEIGAAGRSYGTQLLPGVIALTLFFTALQNTALPLVIEFSFTKEIEDRLLAPLPAWAVGVQKLVVAAVRGIVGAIIILPFAAIILPGGVQFSDISWLGFVAVLLIGPLAGAAVGLVLGTAVEARQINVVFAVVLTPLLFTGATFYPWAELDSLRWFQIITLINPLTYVSEGLRAALTASPHLGTGWIALGLVGWTIVFGFIGVRGFEKRAID
ncbi:MAG TPA: ABC transporter permease [Baekduia sp.]|uniref:ABC transporter permease n=1 Tax=Baekduia sp. TaxID=2600305 RepID=UPI002D79CC5D|nr:ABC transporter permease [Baekduia sp.]HET6508636.1 ABC transporter permease [Baekduia sp.]